MSEITTLKNYPGNKSSSSAYPTIMNHIPRHKWYVELFAGSAEVAKKIVDSESQVTPFVTLNELNPIVCELLRNEFHDGISVVNDDAICYLNTYNSIFFAHCDKTFIYLDPPYLLSSRRSGGDIYGSFEMSDDDHVKLLTAALQCKSMVMISGYKSALYDHYLKDWQRVEFDVMTRRGPATEIIWMNYNIDDHLLHTYDYIGHGRTDRQRINRKQLRMINKIESLPIREREKLLFSLKDQIDHII